MSQLLSLNWVKLGSGFFNWIRCLSDQQAFYEESWRSQNLYRIVFMEFRFHEPGLKTWV